ncbi:RsmD family RNA methyltransferase [Cellulophaga sp. E16_2]|uniref:Methyltransferase n=1 Tax=Cellulophaga algicola (strain DSM 14237 / IC166 / ACAM 630) TaxID=688270 RepID=E6XDN5_CELAD|nr:MULTISPECIES: RsmD family RNA methyltransferase [Cellulophaga]ADV50177.1 methyltransferase [Cellulophaga algicola DSM 14237]MBO0592561.1 RsmD family RNA methyltransferase [Cellulophaga sp. E16_2]
MRIISGKHRGRKLTAPSKLPVRPTTDMAKEGLFNILNNNYYLPDISVLDLFSGTGNIAFEFGSRGCDKITAVDADQGCVKFITETTEKLELSISALKSDVFSYLEKTTAKNDIIFADPPYDLPIEDFEKIPTLVFSRNLLLADGLLIVEHSKHTDLSKLPNFSKQRKYGGSVFSFFEANS